LHKEFEDLFNEIKSSFNQGLPFVISRQPKEKELICYIQNTKILHELKSYNDVGFVFAPFSKNDKKVIFPIQECTVHSANIINVNQLKVAKTSVKTTTIDNIDHSKRRHVKLVKKGIKFIEDGHVKKVVLSRCENLKNESLDIVDTYKTMLKNYENALVYMWFHPAVGLWMGATPERLITIDKNKFRTMSLAGTQNYNDTINVNWKQKELKEQQFVTDYILKNIKENIDDIKCNGPYTVKAGKLLHLRTDISGELKTVDLLEKLIKSLHPTPAVCGLPRDISADFIVKNENYRRTYYSGYLGELNVNKKTNLFVNLRCMEIHMAEVSIFVGGGITIDSDAVSEWEETVSKANIMKKVL